MNTKYNKITGFDGAIDKLKKAPEIIQNIVIPKDIPHGDMPGDKVEIVATLCDYHRCGAVIVIPIPANVTMRLMPISDVFRHRKGYQLAVYPAFDLFFYFHKERRIP